MNECWPAPSCSLQMYSFSLHLPITGWPAPAMVVERILVEDIFELVSLVLSLIISRTSRILAHEEDPYTDFLSLSLKLTKAGPRSSGTLFLVKDEIWHFNIIQNCKASLKK